MADLEKSLAGHAKDVKDPKDDDRRAMGLSAVVSVMFFTVCGGPIGCEEVIAAGGPGRGLLAMLIFPWLYCFPVALVSAELATVFPEDGSFTIWVSNSFGRFWAFQDGYWSWISGVIDNAMYPVLATELMLGADRVHSATGVLLTLTISLTWSLMNFAGVEIVARLMVILGIIVLTPYVGLIFLAIGSQLATLTSDALSPTAEPSSSTLSAAMSLAHRVADATMGTTPTPLAATAAPLQEYGRTGPSDPDEWHFNAIELLHVVFWSYSGWDSVSTFAGEVRDPKRNFPRALALAMLLTCASYVLSLGAGILTPGAPDWRTWSEGSFHEIGRAAGGEFLHSLIFISTGISLLAMYCTEMFVDSFLLLGMAEQELVPRIFARRSARGGAPWVAISASLVVIVIVAPIFDFTKLMQVNNCLTCMSVFIELLAGMSLRTSAASSSQVPHEATSSTPSSSSSFRAPVSNKVFVAMQIPAMVVIFLVVTTTVLMTSLEVQLLTLVLIIAGAPLYQSCATQDLRIE
ncbi:Amino acid-polyamine transporter, putative [Hondaea fermentalgiana]|uniref:Amino acid-polyamine transporter, putative n=1 Tax=Hondaea fermentalgiana TaxID=2315210 RepID=A0A2R5GI28_9STRA|nr:Amino acid-polyamine transporter, putative [Hondaea fermentalgiana]|eukprot:GBG30542.1 Amino acid-polyamine transporter, putative [Hondaea fermentalgiana]